MLVKSSNKCHGYVYWSCAPNRHKLQIAPIKRLNGISCLPCKLQCRYSTVVAVMIGNDCRISAPTTSKPSGNHQRHVNFINSSPSARLSHSFLPLFKII